MKQSILIGIMLISSVSFVCAQNDVEIQKEQEVIKKLIQTTYVDGLANEGDMDKINEGFHPGFILLGIGEEQDIWTWTIDKWKQNIEHRKEIGKLPRTGNEKASIKFLSVDIVGTLAVVKIELYFGTQLSYIDYLNLYKFDDNWKIVCKTWYKIPEDKEYIRLHKIL